MIMGLKLSPSNSKKYITGTLNKGANGEKRVVFLGWIMGKGREGKGREGKRSDGKGRGKGREGVREGKGKEGKERMGMGMINNDSLI